MKHVVAVVVDAVMVVMVDMVVAVVIIPRVRVSVEISSSVEGESESESLSGSENEIELNVGDRITGEWGGEENNDMWYDGEIIFINIILKTAHVKFDDGDEDDLLPWVKIRLI